MKRRGAITRVGIALLLGMVVVMPVHVWATPAPLAYSFAAAKDVLITELQTSGSHGAGEEFIELYNNTDRDIDLADAAHTGKNAWKIQYFSKTKLAALLPASTMAAGWVTPYRTIALNGTIAAGDYYVLAADKYIPGNIEPDQTYSSTLADEGGALQLVDIATTNAVVTTTVHDRLAWSGNTTLASNNLLYTPPRAGQSLQRMPNQLGSYVNEDTSLTSFTLSDTLSPKNIWSAAVPTEPVVPTPDTPPSASAPNGSQGDGTAPPPSGPVNDGLAPPIITEVLPNPAAPQSDEISEYIELYNPNNTDFNLRGYTLETGQTTLHDFTFAGDTILKANSYQPFYSAETRLPLSNSGGQGRLLDPHGTVVNETAAYPAATDGMAWALDERDGNWKWTTALTPGSSNLIIIPAVATKVTAVKTAAKQLAKPAAKTTKKPIAKAKVLGLNTTKAKKAAATKKPSARPKVPPVATSASTAPTIKTALVHPAVLATVALLAIGYGVYEYRHDLANRIYQFRAHRAARRAAGK